jgi:hypothetical protein
MGSAWKSTTDPSTSKQTQATCPAGPTFDVLIVYTFSRITKRENRLLASAFLQAPREKVLNEGSKTPTDQPRKNDVGLHFAGVALIIPTGDRQISKENLMRASSVE